MSSGSITVRVRQGERMADLARRLEAAGVLAATALEADAALEPLHEVTFVPPPHPAAPLRRFEGLTVPGTYRTPYHTYLHRGLPPTPICFFSNEALRVGLARHVGPSDPAARGDELPNG